MKKLLLLIPALAGGLMLTGCQTDVAVVAPQPPGPVVYGDPYYAYGGVSYYSEGGRYYYWHNHARVYVGGLPGGGVYFHNGHRYRHFARGRWY